MLLESELTLASLADPGSSPEVRFPQSNHLAYVGYQTKNSEDVFEL